MAPTGAVQELGVRPEVWDPMESSFALLVSSFATEEVIKQIPSTVRTVREVARAQGMLWRNSSRKVWAKPITRESVYKEL